MFEKLFSDRGLSLDRLRALIEIHDAGGIAKAAPGDLVRQSQYSRQLRELSEFFGIDVARRTGRQLRLTTQGVQLAEMARTHFQSLQDFRAACLGEAVDYAIGAGDSLIQWLVIPRVATARESLANIRLATHNLRTLDVVQQLNDGRIDFGIIRRDAVVRDLKHSPLGTLRFTLVVPKTLLGRKKSLSFAEVLTTLPFASHTSDGVFTERLKAIAKDLGKELRPSLICQSFPQALAAVRSGGYASILPAISREHLEPGSYIEVHGEPLPTLERELALVWSPRLTRVRPGAKKIAEAFQRAWVL